MKNSDGATIECMDCDWSSEFSTAIEHGELEGDDEVVILGEPEACPACGSDDLFHDVHGVRLRDEGREDFHSDG
jgi:hypothetical protein